MSEPTASPQPPADARTSVLLSVYHRADPAHLRRAIESILDQTTPPDELVLVEDGPVPPGLTEVLAAFDDGPVPVVHVRLPENRGLGEALNAGLEHVHHPWVVRMDADDVALPGRIEAQLAAAREGGFDVVGGAMAEFEGEEENVVGVRRLPTTHEEIRRYVRTANPVNHPTVLMRRDAVRAVGGYRHVPYMEDYDLWSRLLASGARFHNLPQPVIRFRSGEAMLRRRAFRGMLAAEVLMQRNLVAAGHVGRARAVVNFGIRTGYRLLPQALLRRAYRLLFHRDPSNG